MKSKVILIIMYASAYLHAASFTAWRADQAYKDADLSKALLLYEEVVAGDPKDMQALYNVGKTAYKLKDYTAAEQAFEKVSRSSLSSPKLKERALFNYADSLVQQHSYPKALASYEVVLRLNEHNEHAQKRINLVKKLGEAVLMREEQERQNLEEEQDRSEQLPREKREDSQDSSQHDRLGNEKEQKGNVSEKNRALPGEDEKQYNGQGEQESQSQKGRKQVQNHTEGEYQQSENTGAESYNSKAAEQTDITHQRGERGISKVQKAEQRAQAQNEIKKERKEHSQPQSLSIQTEPKSIIAEQPSAYTRSVGLFRKKFSRKVGK